MFLRIARWTVPLALMLPACNLGQLKSVTSCVVHKLASALLSEISDALLQDTWEADLKKIGIREGFDVLDCALTRFISSSGPAIETPLTFAPNSPITPRSLQIARAQAWRAQHPIGKNK